MCTCVVFAVHNVPAIITNYFLLNLFGRKLSMNDNIQYSLALKYPCNFTLMNTKYAHYRVY